VGVGAVLTLLLFAADAPADPELTDTQLAGRAEAAFEEGHRLRDTPDHGKNEFQTAAALYEQLRQRGVANPALYCNLGNAYVLADDVPSAILTFQRGLRLWPHDAGLQNSLAEARALVVYSVDNPLGRPPIKKRLTWLPPFAVEGLLLAVLVFYSAMCVSVTRWWMTRRGWLLAFAALCLLLASLPAALLTWLHLDDSRRHAETERPLVVINDDGVLLRKGDSLKYPARYDTPLNRGVEARLVHERGDWVQIELAGGEIGWVPRRFVLVDRPGAG
jgi:hypothetical protein